MSRWRRVAGFLGLRRNPALLLVALVLAGTGERLWLGFVPKYLEALGAPVTAIGLFGSCQDLLDGLYQYPGGWIGDRYGLVGRFYSSHITGDLGEAVFSPEAAAAFSTYFRDRDGVYCRRSLALHPRTQFAERLLNMRVILSHPSPADPSHDGEALP